MTAEPPSLRLAQLPAPGNRGAWAFLWGRPGEPGQLVRMHEWRLLFATREEAARAARRFRLVVDPVTGMIYLPPDAAANPLESTAQGGPP